MKALKVVLWLAVGILVGGTLFYFFILRGMI